MNENEIIPRYRNRPWWKETEFYNDLMKKMENEYCRWYGSAWGLSHNDISKLRDDIYTGKTTWTKWKKEFAEMNIRVNMGLGPNDPIPQTKRKVNLSKVSDEDLINEVKKRNLV